MNGNLLNPNIFFINVITSVNELNKYKNTYKIGDKIKLTVYRNNTETEFEITLAETPENLEESSNTTTQVPNYNSNSGSQFFSGSIFDLFR